METKNPIKMKKNELIDFLKSLNIQFEETLTVPELQKLIPVEFLVETPVKEKKFLVETPVRNFNGTVAGVQFAYGKAEVNEGWILSWFKEKGYRVTEVE